MLSPTKLTLVYAQPPSCVYLHLSDFGAVLLLATSSPIPFASSRFRGKPELLVLATKRRNREENREERVRVEEIRTSQDKLCNLHMEVRLISHREHRDIFTIAYAKSFSSPLSAIFLFRLPSSILRPLPSCFRVSIDTIKHEPAIPKRCTRYH